MPLLKRLSALAEPAMAFSTFSFFFALGTGCGPILGGDSVTPLSPEKMTKPVVDSGGDRWEDDTSKDPKDPKDSKDPKVSQPDAGTTPDTGTKPPAPAIHNTDYCRVDDAERIVSSEYIKVDDGTRVHGIAGKCISHPIREVWGRILNHQQMKPYDVTSYTVTPRTDLIDLSRKIYLAFDIVSRVKKVWGVVDISWTVEWIHSIPFGTPADPKQIVINFSKVSGSNVLKFQEEGYVLDRVTPNITSFVMDQTIESKYVDTERVHNNIRTIFDILENGTPDMSELPN